MFRMFLCAGLLLGMILSAERVIANDYTVQNIKVDVEGDSAIDAREKALNTARRNAFDVLMGRMVDAGVKSSLPKTEDSAIASMVDSFEINREKLSKNRYLASVNVSFNERAVNAYIGRYTNVALPDDHRSVMPEPSKNNAALSTDDLYAAYSGKDYMKSTPSNTQVQAVDTRITSAYQIQINLSNIRQWVAIQKSLKSIPATKAVEVNSLNSSRAIVTVSYAGDAQALQGDLNARGMRLYTSSGNQYQEAPYILMTQG